SLRAGAKPIRVNGKLVAWAVALTRPNLSRLDETYLRAIHHALICGAIAAAFLALTLGVLFGTRLSQDLRALTAAIQAMEAGYFYQQVRVKSSDEIRIVANAFNRMSAELTRAQVDLRRTAAQVCEQAARLKELSMRDELTGLYNRRHFDEHAARMFAQA